MLFPDQPFHVHRPPTHLLTVHVTNQRLLVGCIFCAHAASLRQTFYFARLKFRGFLHSFSRIAGHFYNSPQRLCQRSLGKIGQRVKLDRMLDHKSIPEIIKAAKKKGSKNLTPADAAEAISTKYGPTVPKELTQKEIDDLADYLVKIYPDRR